jgi:predicted class III extradiol MEMO1 family dioxygenase
MDHEAMAILTIPLSPPASSTAEANLTGEVAHTKFTSYLNKTHNTICGRHPIGVLFAAIGAIQRDRATQSAEGEGDNGAKEVEVKWVRYAQSSQCFDISDSSVSYASAYVVF